MPILSPKNLVCLSLVSLGLTVSGACDTITLKDGREIKGDIIKNDSNGVLIEYFVTATIKDQKTFSSDEITKIVTLTEDEKAFLALGSRATPPTVLDTSFYDPLIYKKIPDFFKQYPYSRHMSELRIDMRSLTSERERVNAGDRRIDGVWITAAQVAADPYQMGARIEFHKLKQQASMDDPVITLKTYELLEKNYPGSAVLPDAIEIARPQLDSLQAKVAAIQGDFDTVAKKRQETISSLLADQAKEMQNSLENEAAQAKADIASATKDGSKFFPIFRNVKESLDALQALIQTERVRLKLFSVSDMRESLSDTADAARLIASSNLKDAQAQLDAAAKLWPANADIATLKQKIEDAAKQEAAKTTTTSK
jgi:hypothetical protein